MSKYFMRCMEMDELKDFYKRIEQDFPPEEYAPYPVLYQQIEKGIQDALVFCEDTRDLGYSFCAASHNNDYVLISLLAVFEECRGQGIGAAFMDSLHLRYKNKQAILVEVERPELSQTSEERELRERRISFYQKAGFYLIPGIDYSIWDVPMQLMALPIEASKQMINERIEQIMYQIYFKLLGEHFIHKMHFKH